jgi:predicted nucleic acid-binding protein
VDTSADFVDTNILVYANLAASPLHVLATERLSALDGQTTELWVSRQIMREYLAAMTRPDVVTATIPIASLTSDVRYFATRFLVAEEEPAVTEWLLRLVERVPVTGRQIHDANIVATMQAWGIRRLLTHNAADLARFAQFVDVLPRVTQ